MARTKSNRRVKTTTPSNNTEIINIKDDVKIKPNFYICHWCGTPYPKLDSNFPSSQSELYKGLDYHLPICRSCLDKMYEHYTDVYGNDEDLAIRRICEKFDIYYCEGLLSASRKITKNRSRIHTYISKANLTQYAGKTYDTTLDEERKRNVIESKEQLEEMKANGTATVSVAAAERWGMGIFNDSEYKTLEDHYKMLKKSNPNCDSNQEIFIKSLCHLNLLMNNALKDGNTKSYIEANGEYAKTFKQAGLKTVQETDKNADDCWGIFMEQISQYTPEEYYKDQSLYKDFDGIGEQFSRFVLRPLRNLLCKTSERDPEYNVEDTK